MNNNKIIGERLRAVRAALNNKSVVDLAAAVNVKSAHIVDVERGKVSISEALLKGLDRHFEVRADYLMQGEEPMFISEGETESNKRIANLAEATNAIAKKSNLSDPEKIQIRDIMYGLKIHDMAIVKSALSSIPDYLMVPKYDIAASAGNGSVINDEAIVDHLAFKREWIKSLGLEAQHIALIDVRGDSMTPTISNGDLILLDTRKGQHLCEGIYAIHLNDGLLVKRIRIKLSGLVEVISDNAQYDTETLTQDKLASLVIIGRVVWHGRRV